MSEFWIGFIIVAVYLIGWVVFCVLNLNRVGTTESNFEGEWNVDTMDVVLEGVFWPFMTCVIILLSPVLLMTFIFEHINNK